MEGKASNSEARGKRGGEEGKKETWGVIGGMVRDRCNFQTTAGK